MRRIAQKPETWFDPDRRCGPPTRTVRPDPDGPRTAPRGLTRTAPRTAPPWLGELNLIQNPADKLIPREEVSVVRYLVAQGDWQRAARTARGAEATT